MRILLRQCVVGLTKSNSLFDFHNILVKLEVCLRSFKPVFGICSIIIVAVYITLIDF